jgi:hypothetical protein
VATLWSAVVQIAVMNWALGNIKGYPSFSHRLPSTQPPSLTHSSICTPDQPDSYTCPGGNVFFTASVIWGAIGPRRIFSPESLYSPLLWYFFLGALLPFVTYFAARRWPKALRGKFSFISYKDRGEGFGLMKRQIFVYSCDAWEFREYSACDGL